MLLQSRPTRDRNTPVRGASSPDTPDFGQELRDRLAGQEPAKPIAGPAAQNTPEAGKLMPSKLSPGLTQTGNALLQLSQPLTPATGEAPNLKAAALATQPPAQSSSPLREKGSSGVSPSSGSKHSKSCQQDRTESGNETDTAQLSSSAQQALSSMSSSDGQSGRQPDKHEEAAPVKPQENSSSKISAPANTDSAVSAELAFAMRISPKSADEPSAQDQRGATETAIASTVPSELSNRGLSSPPLEAAQQRSHPEIPSPTDSISIQSPSVSADSSKTAGAEQTGKSQQAGFETELNKAMAEPVRAAHVQIAGSDNQRVDIRMLERGGALSVTVRSVDSGLTKALQDHAPDLAGRLSLENFRTELWAPGQGKTPNGRDFDGGNPQSQGGGGNSGQRHPGQQQKEHKGRESQTPEWIENFEKNPTAFQQRIEYIWHQ